MKDWDPLDCAGITLVLIILSVPVLLVYSERLSDAAYQNALTTVLDCRQKQVRLSGPVGLDAVCGPIPRREDF
jgi:hypothetical protein